MDDTQLIEKLTTLLGSCLTKAGEKFAVKVAEQAGSKFTEKAAELWSRLCPSVESKESAKEAVEDLLDDPEDSDCQAALRQQLKKLLKRDRELAQALAGLVETIETISTSATVHGEGAIAQNGSVAAGKGGAAVGGDVHGDLHIHNQSTANNDETALRNAYLNCIMKQSGALSLDGIDPSGASDRDHSRLELNAVYTALLTRSHVQSKSKQQAIGFEGDLRGDKQQSAIAQLNEHRFLVLQGEPGGGKSTFVNFVTLCMAGGVMEDPAINLNRLTAPLPNDKGEDQEESQPWEHNALLPLPIILRDFAATGLPKEGEATAQHLWDFIEQWLTKRSLAEYSAHLKHTLLNQGGLVLFDGLDEVPEANKRRLQVKQAIEDFAQVYGRCRILVTSRTYAYQNQTWRLSNFAEAVLAPLSDGQIIRFVDGWYRHVSDDTQARLSKDDAQGKAVLLKQAITTQPRIRELAERPLLLTLMASLHTWRGGSLPERREQLYADAVELLLNQWEVRRIERDSEGNVTSLLQPSIAEWLNTDKEAVRKVLEAQAFEAHNNQPELVGTADIDEGRLIAELMGISNNPDANPKHLIEYLRERSGLLMRRGDKVYTFPHRTFQEYLAACYLTDENYPKEIANLARQAPERWREVALLAGAKAVRGSASTVWQLAEYLCHREHDDTDARPEDSWGAQLAGQALVESADLGRVSNANQPKLARVRDWLVKLVEGDQLPAPERAIAGNSLAEIGDPRFSAECFYLPDDPLLGFRYIPAGEFLMGSDKEKDMSAYDVETPQHRLTLPDFYMARWQVSVAQYRFFVEQSGYSPENLTCIKGIANHPVVYVTWHDALAYCRWLDDQVKQFAEQKLALGDFVGESAMQFYTALAKNHLNVSLPSVAEWEKAARGNDGYIYPCGDEIGVEEVNSGDTGIDSFSSAGCFGKGASPFGCEDMSGNTWEWTRSLWGESGEKPQFEYPYDKNDGREALDVGEKVCRELRGGAYFLSLSFARCAFRNNKLPPNYVARGVGFRVVLSPFSEC